MKSIVVMCMYLLLLPLSGCGQDGIQKKNLTDHGDETMEHTEKDTAERTGARRDSAVIGGGCFWCVEAVFEQLEGVLSVESGYAGGHTEHPTYDDICTGTTGHAEVIRITFDADVISYDDLLGIFWQAHDPTTLNRQGADVGTQYRSVIFYADESQRVRAEASRDKAQAQFRDPIVTEISALPVFYVAEDYHQDYFRNNRNAPYCQIVIRPKLKKLGLSQ